MLIIYIGRGPPITFPHENSGIVDSKVIPILSVPNSFHRTLTEDLQGTKELQGLSLWLSW